MTQPNLHPHPTTETHHQLVLAHQGLLHLVARPFLGKTVSYEDLISAGQIGLVQAAKRFQQEKGYQFSTFAVWHIRSRVQRALAQEKAVKVGEQGVRKARRTGAALPVMVAWDEVGRQPAREGGLGQAHARAMLGKLQARLTTLPEAQRRVMVARFFTAPQAHPRPLRQVAAELGLAVSTVYTLEQQARWNLGLACGERATACCHEEATGSCLRREWRGATQTP